MLNKLSFLLAVLCLAQTISITSNCFDQGCPAGCSQCVSLEGGPFNKVYTKCYNTTDGCPIEDFNTFNFDCSGCKNGVDCSYRVILKGAEIYNGCTNQGDINWNSTIKPTLDALYKEYVSTTGTYDWCSESCSDGSSGAIKIIAIIGGVLVFVGLAAVVVRCIKKRKVQDYQKV